VRHGVVDVQDIELELAGHLGHLHGKGQCIVRILEQTVGIDPHRVEVDAVGAGKKAEGTLVADEVDVVSALGKLGPK
jgi:hypothetical protein